MAANDTQVGGSHYKNHGNADLQHWDMVVLFKLDYFQGQITKYIMRWRDKGGVKDLEKAQHFLAKYIEVATAEQQKMDEAVADSQAEFDRMGEGWHVRREGTNLVASFRGAAKGGKGVARPKVRAARGKK